MEAKNCSSIKNIREILRQHYTRYIDLCFSPDGKYAIAIDHNCRFVFFSTFTQNLFLFYWDVSYKPLCIKSNDLLLVCGDAQGFVHFYEWSSLLNCVNKDDVRPNRCSVKFVDSEIVDILVLPNNETQSEMIIACRNGSIHLCDIKEKKILNSFQGHLKQINKLAMQKKTKSNIHDFVSCSKDGLVHSWDVRSGKLPVRTIHVSDSLENSQVIRPSFSRDILALDFEDSFVVCGGGVELGLWHLDSGSLICKLNHEENKKSNITMETNEESNSMLYLSVEVFNGQILVGGITNTYDWNGTRLSRFNYSGEHLSSLKLNGISSINKVLTFYNNNNCTKNVKEQGLTLVAGNSPNIYCINELGFFLHSIDTSNAIPCKEFINN